MKIDREPSADIHQVDLTEDRFVAPADVGVGSPGEHPADLLRVTASV
ncbi:MULTISPECIES: hypothetical protein [unclassified Microbacterium]